MPERVPHEVLWGAALRCFTTGAVVSLPASCARHCERWCPESPVRAGGGAGGLYTWKPAASIWVTILKASHACTALVVHPPAGGGAPPRVHRMAPHAGLARCCPAGTSLLGQVIFDAPPGGGEPTASIVVFDVLQVGASLDATGLPPRDRHRILREECEPFFQGSCIRTQWAGDLEPARAFCAPGGGLPLDVECIFRLSDGHPCAVARAAHG